MSSTVVPMQNKYSIIGSKNCMLIFPQNDFDFGKAAGVYTRCSTKSASHHVLSLQGTWSVWVANGLPLCACLWAPMSHIFGLFIMGHHVAKARVAQQNSKITRWTGRIFTTIEMREDKTKVNQNSATKSPENREDRPCSRLTKPNTPFSNNVFKKPTTHHPIMSLSARAQLWHFESQRCKIHARLGHLKWKDALERSGLQQRATVV